MMPMVQNDGLTLLCVLVGIIADGAIVLWALQRLNAPRERMLLATLFPGIGLFLCAKLGYELFQYVEQISIFRWCFTTGLLGLVLGTCCSARWCRVRMLPLLDMTATGMCAAMCFARIAQRWQGEVGIGPWLAEDALLNQPLLVVLNEWKETILAIWILEALAALIALGLTLCSVRSKYTAPGASFCRAMLLLSLPQVLLEQFRTGHYMRFRIMRLEQVLLALVALTVVVAMCRAYQRRTGVSLVRAWWPVVGFAGLTAVVGMIQFVLDGKLFELSDAVSWTIYVFAVICMLVISGGTVQRWVRSVGALSDEYFGRI